MLLTRSIHSSTDSLLRFRMNIVFVHFLEKVWLILVQTRLLVRAVFVPSLAERAYFLFEAFPERSEPFDQRGLRPDVEPH